MSGPSEWQSLWHQHQGGSRSRFTAPEMLAYPLAYIISPRRTLGRRRSTSSDDGKEDKRLSFHRRFRLFPPSGWLFHKLRIDNQSGPPGGIWEAASTDNNLPPVCVCACLLLPGWEVREASTKPDLIPPTLRRKCMSKNIAKRLRAKRKRSDEFSLGHTVFLSLSHINDDVYSLSHTGK